MKKSNKLIAGIVTLASVMTLTACQSTNDNTKVISMKGDTISVSDFYNETKHTEVSQKAMLNLVVSRVLKLSMVIKYLTRKSKKLTIKLLISMVPHSQQPWHSQA